jgi:hypothetical protein
MICGPLVLAGWSIFAAAGARAGGGATGAAAVTSGVETATSCGLRNGRSRSAIAPETPTTARTTATDATAPALTLPPARGARMAWPSGRSMDLPRSAKPCPRAPDPKANSLRNRLRQIHRPFRVQPAPGAAAGLQRPGALESNCRNLSVPAAWHCLLRPARAAPAYWLSTAFSGLGGKAGSVFSPRSSCSAKMSCRSSFGSGGT